MHVTAIIRSAEAREALSEAVRGLPAARLDSRIGALKNEVHSFTPGDAAVVEIDADDAEDLAALNRIRAMCTPAKVPVLVTAAALSAVAARRLLRDGVADFLPQPLCPADVRDALQNARRQRLAAAGDRRGRVFVFGRAAGGMGATTLAIAFGLDLIRRGRKSPPRVCLLDLDVQFGAAALQLDLDATAGLAEIVKAPERLDPDLLRTSMTLHASGLHVLSAPPMPLPLEALKAETAERLVELARAEFDYVLVDLPLALTGWTSTVLSQAEAVFLTTTLGVPAIRQLRRLLDICQDEGLYALPIRLVLNRAAGGFGFGRAGVSRRQAEQALARGFDFLLPEDRTVRIAADRGVPLAAVRRRSCYSRAVAALVEVAERSKPVSHDETIEPAKIARAA